MAIKPGWGSQPDERVGFGGGSGNSPFKAEMLRFGVGFMVTDKITYFVFIKESIQDTRMNLVQRKYSCFPTTALERLLVFLNTNRKIS